MEKTMDHLLEPNIPESDIPSLIFGQMKRVRRKMQRAYTEDPYFEQFDKFLDSMLNRNRKVSEFDQRPILALYPNLKAKPFWYASDSSELDYVSRQLKELFPIILKEYKSATQQKEIAKPYVSSYRYNSLAEDDWRGFLLGSYEGVNKNAKQIFPETCAFIEQIQHLLLGRAEFLVLKKGSVIPDHTDATNMEITCQLGLIEHGNCAIRVLNRTEELKEGGVIFFDHSYVHSAWNRGDGDRVVLLLDLKHPDLSQREMFFFREFQRLTRIYSIPVMPILFIKKICIDIKKIMLNR